MATVNITKLYIDSGGTLVHSVTPSISRGNDSINQIQYITPFDSSFTMYCNFQLANGEIVSEKPLTLRSTEVLDIGSIYDGDTWNVKAYDVEASILSTLSKLVASPLYTTATVREVNDSYIGSFTTSEMNALTGMSDEDFIYNETTETSWEYDLGITTWSDLLFEKTIYSSKQSIPNDTFQLSISPTIISSGEEISVTQAQLLTDWLTEVDVELAKLKTQSDGAFEETNDDVWSSDYRIATMINNLDAINGIFTELRLNGDNAIGGAVWNSTDMTWEIKLNANVTLQVGQEEVIYAYNPSTTIVDTKVVYISGAQGQKPTVALASNDVKTKAHNTIGVATEELTNNQSGFVTTRGFVRNVNTSAWSDGDILYLGSNGSMTDTIPTPPLFNVQVGYVINGGSVGAGIIYVQVDKVHEIQESPDVYMPTITDGDIPKWNGSNNRFEEFDIDTALSDAVDVTDAKLLLKADQATTYTITEIDNKLLSVYISRGQVATYADLASKEATAVAGDVWRVLIDENTDGSTNVNYAWLDTGADSWDNLGGIEALATASNDGLMSQEDYTKTATVEANSQENIIEIVRVNGSAEVITSKAIDIDVPIKTSELQNDGNGSYVFVTTNDIVGGGDMFKVDYDANTNGIVDDAETTQQVSVVELTKGTLGKFYATVTGLTLTSNREIIFLFPNSTTDLTENVEVSLNGVAGTYKYLKYDDTLNNVVVKHTVSAQIKATYNGTELLMKGEPLVPQELTFTEINSSTYNSIKPINGQAVMNEVKGLMLNQQVVNGDFDSGVLSPFTTALAGTPVITDGVAIFTATARNGKIGYTLPMVNGNTYYISGLVKTSGSLVGLSIAGVGKQIHSGSGNFERLSSVFEWTASSGNWDIVVLDDATSGWFEVQATDIITVDITNTPYASLTASEIDLRIQDYFEGTDYITNFEMQSHGVNGFDKSTVSQDQRWSHISGNLLSDTLYVASDYIKVAPNTEYFWNGYTNKAFFDSNKVFISGVTSTIYFTTPSNCVYVGVSVLKTDIDTAQLNYGTVELAYQAYSSPTNFTLKSKDETYLHLLSVGTSIRDKAYELNGIWYKDNYVGRDYNDVVQSVTTWTIVDDLTITQKISYDFSSLLDYVVPSSSTLPNAFVKIGNTTFTTVTKDYINANDEENIFMINTTGLLTFRVNKTTYSTTGDWETYLQANDVEFLYELNDIVQEEILKSGSIIQEANTTLIQVNNFATEIDVEFSCNANALLATLNDKIIYLQTMLDKVEEPQWTDLRTPMTPSQINPTNSKPDFDYTNIGLLFPQNDTSEIVYTSFQMPHSYKEGSDIEPHIHMGQALDLQAVFKLEYIWVNIGDTLPATWTTITLDTYGVEYVSGTLHQILKASAHIDGTGMNISSILKCKLYRDDNVYTGDVLVSDFDVHYQEDANGSVEEYVK